MINVFKNGGAWKTVEGLEYTAKNIEQKDLKEHLANGWVKSLGELTLKSVNSLGVDGGEYERELRDKIKALGGKAGGRASIETLEAKLAELEQEAE